MITRAGGELWYLFTHLDCTDECRDQSQRLAMHSSRNTERTEGKVRRIWRGDTK